jgi:hypothetical protein
MFKRPVSITSLKNQVMTSIIIGLSVFLILVVFQPFGTFGFRMSHKTFFLAGYGVICTSIYIIYYAFVMSIFKKWFAPLNWNILKEIVTLLPALFLISFASLWYHHLIIGGYEIDINDVSYFFRISLAVAVIPFSILFYRKMLLSNLTTIQQPDSESGYSVTFESNNKNEKPVTE